MPPRLPLVLIFFIFYFSVIVGGGTASLIKEITLPLPEVVAQTLGVDMLRLTIAEAIAALAALFAAPDAALRPARTAIDRILAVVVAAAAITVGVIYPQAATLGYGALTALAIGDAITALFIRRREPVATRGA